MSGPSGFSRDVLQQSRASGAAPLAPCRWYDWGTPLRVFNSLRGMGELTSSLGTSRSGDGLSELLPPHSAWADLLARP
jgi:hypothetical protein